MGKTTVTNNVGFNVQVKEGNANIFRILKVLKTGESMTIESDSAATYREYVLIVLPDNTPLRQLSSDDIQEQTAIEIFKDETTGKLDWRALRGGDKKKSLLSSLLGLFSGSKAPPFKSSSFKSSRSKAEPSNPPTATE